MFTAIRRHVLIPFHETAIRRRSIAKYRRFLEESQWWPRERLLEHQWQELGRMLRHAYDEVPFWRERFDQLGLKPGDIRSYSEFQALPITEKQHIRENRPRMIARNLQGKTWTKSTAGSTGEPLQLDYNPDSYDWRWAVTRRGYSWAGHEEGMRQVSIWGLFTMGEQKIYRDIKEKLHHRMQGRLIVNALKLDESNMPQAVELINDYDPVTIVGYTNPLYQFAQYLRKHGGLRVRPKGVISAAEKLFDYQRPVIEEGFGCQVFETYGSREVMLIGAECGHRSGLHLSTENLYVEILREDDTPAAPGESGTLVVSDLHNYGMPFIRYRLGDLAVASDAVCPCGRGLPLLQKVVGRTLDMIKMADGRTVPGEFFPHLLKEVKGIKQWQAVQNSLTQIDLKIVKDEHFTDEIFAEIKAGVAKMFGDAMHFQYIFVDRIPLTKAGKLRVMVSNLDSPQAS
jgi:phenylacetate-CoA ligase